MDQDKKWSTIGMVVFLGLLVQLLLGFADNHDTPNKATVNFVKAYLMLDKSVVEKLCHEEGISEAVNHNIQLVADEARDRGFDVKRLANKLYHIETHTISKDDSNAKIRITAHRRAAVNPFFTENSCPITPLANTGYFLGKIFGFTETHEFDETINLTKEEAHWKICGEVFSLPI